MKIKLGLSGLNTLQLIEKSAYVLSQMDSNPNFVSPNPSIASISVAVQDLIDANEASLTGNHQAVQVRNDKYEILLNLMIALGSYIQNISAGNGTVITSSGFETQQQKTPKGIPPAVQNLKASGSGFPHGAKLEWKSLKKDANFYTVMVTQTDPVLPTTEWTTIGSSTKASFTAENLGNTVPKYFWFQVFASNAAGFGPVSDPAKCLVV